MRITTLCALVGGRVAFNTRAYFVSFAILGQRRLCACPLKDLPPTQLCKEVSLCSCMVRLGSDASTQQLYLKRMRGFIFRVGGRVTSLQKVVGIRIKKEI